ncbi:MAG: helix-turn-helix domain-containing protein [Cucumibacter sp.]
MNESFKRQDIHNSNVPVICRSCEARHTGICGVLDAGELTELARHTRQVTHKSGDELVGEATEITSYATITSGVVKLAKTLRDGRQQVVGLQFAPDFLGRLFGEESRLTAEAVGEVSLCKLPRQALEAMIAANPDLEHRIMLQTLRELDEARDWMVTVGRKTAPEKVASFLCLIATHNNPTLADDDSNTTSFDLPLSRADIADYLGLTIETVSRQFTKLRVDGVIKIVNNRHIEVPDLERLRERCG